MPDQEPLERFNHYKLWKAETKEFRPVAVSLKGQFDKDGTKNKLRSFGWIANPVHKIFHDKTSAIVNSEAHLLGYVLAEQDEPARWVSFKNQLSAEPVTWTLGPPEILLVPSSKAHEGKPPAPPKTIDHFECYRAKGPIVKGPVILQDQFDALLKTKETAQSLIPVLFGVPVSKNGEPLLHPTIHLAIYEFDERPMTKPIQVTAADQFGIHVLEAVGSVMLAVPTAKINWGMGNP
jgi:hypothetical protein